MDPERPSKAPLVASQETMGVLLRKLRRALVAVTSAPLIAIAAFILWHAPTGYIPTGWITLLFAALLVLMLAGTQMLFRLIASVVCVAQGGALPGISAPPAPGTAIAAGARRSIRHTAAEAIALIGAIPILALGYVVVKYVLWIKTTENVLLIACIVAMVITLGIARINSLTRRILLVSALARSVRTGTPAAVLDFGKDEIGALSGDLVQIADSLSTQSTELRRARNLIERLPHPMLVIDAAGAIVTANEAALNLLGYGERELAGRQAASLFAREVAPEWVLGGGGGAVRENAWRRADGALVPVSVRVGALAGNAGGAVLIATDISERARAEENLIVFRELINRSGENLSIIDVATGRYTYANDTTCASTGYSREELLGMRVGDIDPTSMGPWDARREHDMRAENPVYTREGLIRRKDGTAFPVEICSSIVRIGGAEHLVATARDITKRRQSEAETFSLRTQLAHISRVASLGVLVSSLAHEINQPLAAILNNAQAGMQLLDADPPDIVEVRGALEDIIADDMRAGNVIRRMRSILKKADRELQSIDVNSFVDDIVQVALRGAWEREITIVRDLAPRLPPVRGDRVELQQVVLNLILNAFDAMKEMARGQRTIHVRTSLEGDDRVGISVRDTGHGISAEHLSVIFEPFFSTKTEGLGMGLPISMMLIEAHGGRLWAENNHDRGATFHIALPVAKEAGK